MGGACCSQSVHISQSLEAELPSDVCKHIQSLSAKFGSHKDIGAIEKFLKLAYLKANREEALVNIISNETAFQHFVRFLQREYYNKDTAAYEEAFSVLNLEVNHHLSLSASLQLDNANTTRKRIAQAKKVNSMVDPNRYNEVIHELGTQAFRAYLNSKQYKIWRAYESGSVQSMRSRLMSASADPHKQDWNVVCRGEMNDIDADYITDIPCRVELLQYSPLSNQAANSGIDTKLNLGKRIGGDAVTAAGSAVVADTSLLLSTKGSSTMATEGDSLEDTKHKIIQQRNVMWGLDNPEVVKSSVSSTKSSASAASVRSKPHMSRHQSFAESAFQSASSFSCDSVLLLGSSWLAMLISGIESVSIGCCLLSVPSKYTDCVTLFTTDISHEARCRLNSDTTTYANLKSSHVAALSKNAEKISISKEKSCDTLVRDSISIANEEEENGADQACNHFVFSYINKQFERDFGYSKKELVNKCVDQLFFGSAAERLKVDQSQPAAQNAAEFEKYLSSGADGKLVISFRRKNGKLTRSFVCFKALFDQHGVLRYILCLSINVPPFCTIWSKSKCLQSPTQFVIGNNVNRQSSGDRANMSQSKNLTKGPDGQSPSSVPAGQASLVASFNSDALIELLDMLPCSFIDDADY